MAKLISFFALFAALCSPCFGSAVVKGIRFPDQVHVDGKTLRLNGIGLLQKTIFHVDVYVAGLYLQKLANHADQILASRELKNVTLVFLRDIPANQLGSAWKEGFENACHGSCGKADSQINRFITMLTSVHRGQEVRLDFFPNRVCVATAGRREVFDGAEFSKIFLSTFIGDRTADRDVSHGLLTARRISPA